MYACNYLHVYSSCTIVVFDVHDLHVSNLHSIPQPVVALARGAFVATGKLCNSGTIGHNILMPMLLGGKPVRWRSSKEEYKT